MENGETGSGVIVDTRGFFCPTPIIKISEAMRKVDGGVVVVLISDDPAIEFDLPAWCRSTGHTIVFFSREGNEFKFGVRKLGSE